MEVVFHDTNHRSHIRYDLCMCIYITVPLRVSFHEETLQVGHVVVSFTKRRVM